MKSFSTAKFVKWTVTAVLCVVFVACVMFSMVYSPLFQDTMIPFLLRKINSPDGIEISADRLRLKFPLTVEADNLQIFNVGDTMVMAGRADISIDPLPLLDGRIESGRVDVEDVLFKLGSLDSTFYIRVAVDAARIVDPSVSLAKCTVNTGKVKLRKGRIHLNINTNLNPEPEDTTPTGDSWRIQVEQLNLDDIAYRMAIEDVIDSLSTYLLTLQVDDVLVDITDRMVDVGGMDIDGLKAAIVMNNDPSDDTEEEEEEEEDDGEDLSWVIRVGKFRLKGDEATFSFAGAKPPEKGFDYNYIHGRDLKIEVDSFYNRAGDLRVPLRHLEINDVAKLRLNARGLFEIRDSSLIAQDFKIRTTASTIDLDAVYDTNSTPQRQRIKVDLDAKIAPTEIEILLPGLKSVVSSLPHGRTLDLGANIRGTMANLDVKHLEASMKGFWDVVLKGYIKGLDDFDNARGNFDIDGNLADINFAKPLIMNAQQARDTKLPPLRLDGNVDINRGIIVASLDAITSTGSLALDVDWNGRLTDYAVSIGADKFPLASFMPGTGVQSLTADVQLTGTGLDPQDTSTDLTLNVDAQEVIYNHQTLRDIRMRGRLNDGRADLSLNSANTIADLALSASGNVDGDSYTWDLDALINRVDLHALGIVDTVSNVAARLQASVDYTPAIHEIDGHLDLNSFDFRLGSERFTGGDLRAGLLTSDSLTHLSVDNRDLRVRFDAEGSIGEVMQKFGAAADTIGYYVDTRHINVEPFRAALPKFDFKMMAGTDNILQKLLADRGTSFRYLDIAAANDTAIHLNASLDSLVAGTTRLDKITVDAHEVKDLLLYSVNVDNEPGTLDDFAHISARGYLSKDQLTLLLRQRNIDDVTGYKLGLAVTATDSTVTLNMRPYEPIIGYKEWSVDPDNYITLYTKRPHFEADLCLNSGDSHLDIYTTRDSLEAHSDNQLLTVDISNFHIADWLALVPFAPPLKGDLTAHTEVTLSQGAINGAGALTITDAVYEKMRLGKLDLDFDLSTKRSGELHALTNLSIDDRRVLTAEGALNDSIADDDNDVDLNLRLYRFPLSMANPFVGSDVRLGGNLNGRMTMRRSLARPLIDGYLAFDSATAFVPMLGTTFSLTDSKIDVENNVVKFNDFALYGVNDDPLLLNGTVDINRLSNPSINLSLKADNIQIVGHSRDRKSDVYGRAFLGIDATARGNLRLLVANAHVTVREGTNVTYVLPEATDAINVSTDDSMVKFVNFADTASVAQADTVGSPGMSLWVNASLTIAQGSTISVDLAQYGTDRAVIQAAGTVEYTMSPMGDAHAVGTLNINSGYVRYSPPLISEVFFRFRDDSSVSFNGNLLNPTLNITAVERVRANITADGQDSRVIYFDVILRAKGTPENLDLSFDLSTDDDATVNTELQAMSPEQRATQAMGLLIYGTYTGLGTSGSKSSTGNPIYSVLTSTLNSWMANHVKDIDISFGVDEYTRTIGGASSNTMSYSYQVSKSLFDDRFKIVVGGNYTTDANVDENFQQNLINDISFEYMLNRTGSMYVRLFRHTGYISILEGQVTQTGVGFVFRRKLRTLADIFRFRRKVVDPILPQEGAPLPLRLPSTPAANPSDKSDRSDRSDKSDRSDTLSTLSPSATKPETPTPESGQ